MSSNEINIEKNRNVYAIEMLFLIAVGIYTIANTLDLTVYAFSANGETPFINVLTKLMRYFSYVLVLIKIIFESIYERQWISSFLFIATSFFVSFLGSHNKIVLFYLLLIVAAKNVKSENILKVTITVQSIILAFCVLGSRLGFVYDYVREDGGRVRHFLGFTWTTTSAILFLFIILQYIYLKKGELTIFENAFLLIMSIYFYIMTNSRFAFGISLLTIVFFAIYKNVQYKGKMLCRCRNVCLIFPGIIAIFAIMLHICYSPNNHLFNLLNKLLSGRLKLGKQAIINYGISLTGKDIEWIGYNMSETLKGTYNYVDCSYVKILLDCGILALLVILLLYGFMLYQSIKYKNFYFTWILIIVLIFNITEPKLFDLAFNPFILLTFAIPMKKIIDNCNDYSLGNNTRSLMRRSLNEKS